MGYQQRSPESESGPANQGIIQCHCGACRLTVADDRAKCFFMCGCSDCRQFAEYAHAQGGVKPGSVAAAVSPVSPSITPVTGVM